MCTTREVDEYNVTTSTVPTCKPTTLCLPSTESAHEESNNPEVERWLKQHGTAGMLEGFGVIIFVGMPGSGKTTLSYMLCHASDPNIKVNNNK